MNFLIIINLLLYSQNVVENLMNLIMELEGRQITKAKIGEEINKLLCN